MPLELTSNDPAVQRVSGIPMGAATADLLRVDATGWAGTGESFSIVVPVLIKDTGVPFQRVVFEASSAGALVFALIYETDNATYWRFSWHVGDGQPKVVGPNIGFDPVGKVVAVALSYQKRTVSSALSRLRLAYFVPGMANTLFSEQSVSSTVVPGTPTQWVIGRLNGNVSPTNQSNARCVFILWVFRTANMGGVIICDGSTMSDSVGSVDVRTLIHPDGKPVNWSGAAEAYPGALWYAMNHSCSGRHWNGSADCRPGRTTAQVPVFDRNGVSFATSYNRVNSATFVGTITHVNPYEASGQIALPYHPKLTMDAGITVPFSSSGPIGSPRPATRRMVNSALKGQHSGQVRSIKVGNSRAVTIAGTCEIQFPDKTFSTGRTFAATYPEMGMLGFPALWNGGLIGNCNLPVPCGYYNLTSVAAESGAEVAEPLWGPDSFAARPLCRETTGNTSVALNVATAKLINTSYSRVWCGSRYATQVSGAPARFQGNGCPRQLNVGHSYRVLIRPEIGLPTTQGLEVGFYILRNPRGSTFRFCKEAAASAQNGANLMADSYTEVLSDLANGNVSAFTISAHTVPTFTTDTTVSANGFITIDNTAGAITANHVGQWLEITTSADARRDISCITAIDNSTPAACRIFYEGALQNTITTASDKAHIMTTPVERYRKIQVTFTANEVAANAWRGIDLRIEPGTAGLGVDKLCMHFRNTDREGLIVGQAARSGCGYNYQQARFYYAVSPVTGTSPFTEMIRLMDPDVIVVATADQGDNISFADNARTSVRTYIQRWTASLADIEPVMYSTGGEWVNEQAFDFNEDGKVSYHQAYQQAAQDLGIPHTSIYYDRVAGTGCFNEHLTGDVTESRTHPSTAGDMRRMMAQLLSRMGGVVNERGRDGDGKGGTDGERSRARV